MIFSTNKSNLVPMDTPMLFAAVCLLITVALFIVVTIKFKDIKMRIMGIWSLTCLTAAIIPLLHNLFGFEKPVTPAKTTFDGDLVVLTDGASFSTTAHFCALIKYHGLGTLVGSETGGTYVCTDSSKDLVLNATRIRFHYSTLAYQVSQKGLSENTGIMPDIIVSPSIKDILNNRDAAMERVTQELGLK